MIAIEPAGTAGAGERWAFETLVDLSRLLPSATPDAPVVTAIVEDHGDGIQAGDGAVRIGRTVLRQVIAVAGGGDEQHSTETDRHGRVPSSANPLVAAGTERTLPIQALADRLRQAAIDSAGSRPHFTIGPWPEGRDWAAAITHDLDIVTGWPLFAALRWAELLFKGEAGRAGQAVAAGLAAIGRAPVDRAIDRILELEQNAGVRATWFVLAGVPSLESWRKGDLTYRLDSPRVRRLLDRIAAARQEIGLHGSLATAVSAERMASERSLVEQVTGRAPAGVRQHFLRMSPPHTGRAAAKAGFTYDSTFGFADRSGFRLGTADVLPLWDELTGTPVGLAEAPLAWMDRALSKYQGEEDPQRWVEDALAMARAARAAGGLWVGLWHPNVVPALGFPGALHAFQRLLTSLLQEVPYIAPLQEIVAWRIARRGLRGRVHPGGKVELTSTQAGTWRVDLYREGVATTSHHWPVPSRG